MVQGRCSSRSPSQQTACGSCGNKACSQTWWCGAATGRPSVAIRLCWPQPAPTAGAQACALTREWQPGAHSQPPGIVCQAGVRTQGSRRAPLARALIHGPWAGEAGAREVHLHFPGRVVRTVLSGIYSQQLEVQDDQLLDVLAVADFLGIASVKNACSQVPVPPGLQRVAAACPVSLCGWSLARSLLTQRCS